MMLSRLPRPSLILRIAIGFGVVVAVSAVSTLISIGYARQTIDNVVTLTESATPIVQTNNELDLLLTQATELFQTYLTRTEADALERIDARIADNREQIANRLTQLRNRLDAIEGIQDERYRWLTSRIPLTAFIR